MIKGDVILVPFPFTDLTGLKNRPALVLLATEYDITVAFISTQIKRASSLGDTVPGILQLGAVFF